MSGKRFVAQLCAFGLLAPFVQAVEITKAWDDPLWAQPPQLSVGAVFPDGSVVSCATHIDFAQPLRLRDAVDSALCNHPQVRIAWAQIKQQANAVGEARATYLPTANATLSRLSNTTTYPSDSFIPDSSMDGIQRNFSFNWRLLDFGGRSANRKSADQLLVAAMAAHDATLQKLMTVVIQAYFDTVANQAALTARSHMAELAEQTWLVERRKEIKGAATHGETLQAATAMAKARLLASRAQGDYQKSLALLKQMMGVSQSVAMTLSDEGDVFDVSGEMRDLDAWLQDAEKFHPGIRMAKARWESDQSKITSVRSEGKPTVDAITTIAQNGYPNQGLSQNSQKVKTVGFTMNIPLFEGFGRGYKIRGAQAQAEQSEAQLNDTTSQVLIDVVKAHADTQTALGTLKASEQLLNAAKAASYSSQRRYDKDVADLIEVLNAQSSLADAQQERIRAVAEWRSAKLRLLANAGILGKLQ